MNATVEAPLALSERIGEQARRLRKAIRLLRRAWWRRYWWIRFHIESAILGF